MNPEAKAGWSFQGRLLDGHSPRPRPCTVLLAPAEMRITLESGQRLVVPLPKIRSSQRVADEVHLALAPESDGASEQRLEVFDPEFLAALDQRISRHGGSAKVSLQRASRLLGIRGWLIVLAIFLPLAWVSYSALFPRLHVLVSRKQERALGELVYDSFADSFEFERDAAFDELVSTMLKELRDPQLEVDFRIELVDTDEVNAMALPGGRILIFRGLVAASPRADVLAGVLAHEIVHAEHRHSIKSMLGAIGMTQFAINAVGGGIEGFEMVETILEASSGLVVLQHSRDHERESDAIAVAKLRRAGRDATGLLDLFHVLHDGGGGLFPTPGWLSTHPSTRERVESVRRLTTGQGETKPWISNEEWETLRSRLDRP